MTLCTGCFLPLNCSSPAAAKQKKAIVQLNNCNNLQNVFKYIQTTDIYSAVNMKRLIEKYKNPYLLKTDLTAEYVVVELEKLFKMQFVSDNKLLFIKYLFK